MLFKHPLLVALALLAIGVAGCASPAPAPTLAAPAPTAVAVVSTPTTEAGPPIKGLAVVEAVRLASPPAGAAAAEAVITGSLGDACTRLTDITVTRQAQTFIITVNTERPANAVCAQVLTTFEEKVQLDVAGLDGGAYVVVANGVSGTLDLAALPKPTATAEPAATAAPAPTATPASALPAPTPTVAQPANCEDRAAFDSDVTIPDNTAFKQGDKFTKVWRVRNTGTCPWQGYALAFAEGEPMNGPQEVPIPGVVAPGAFVDISVEFTAPKRGGSHTGRWNLRNAAGKRFPVGVFANDTLWVIIVVNYSGQENAAPAPSSGGGAAPVAVPAGCNAVGNAGFEAEVLALINGARAANGLAPYAPQAQLQQAATQHTLDMACNNFIGHTGSDGSKVKNRVGNLGYANNNTATENVFAQTGGTPQLAFDWWMNSEPHRKNILSERATEIGVGYVRGPNGFGYFTLVFARPWNP